MLALVLGNWQCLLAVTLNLWPSHGCVQTIGALHLFTAPHYDAPTLFNESLTVQTPNSTYDCDVVSPSSNDGIKLSLIRHSREFHAARKVQSSVGKNHDAYTNVHPIHILRTMQAFWLEMRTFLASCVARLPTFRSQP